MINEENILIQAGLSSEQSAVYQALLGKGPQKASDLSKWTGIKRGLMYKVLEQLENMSLVTKNENEGAITVFSPSHPSLLLENIERKEREMILTKEMLANSIGTLSSKFNLIAGKPNVQFFEGKEAIDKITGDYPKKDIEIRQWIDISEAMKSIGDDTVHYLNERIKKNISKRMVVSNTEENLNYIKSGSLLTSFKKIDKDLPTAIQVYDNIVSMLTLSKDKNIGLIIEDKDIALTLKNIFDTYWEKSEEIN